MKEDCHTTKAVSTLQEAGILATEKRLAVLDILQQSKRPLCVGDIRKALGTKTHVNKVTVYRIVSLLKKRGILRDISSPNGYQFFEMATSDHPMHPHFNCTYCGTLHCLTPLTLSQTRRIFDEPMDFTVQHIEINITGICNQCLDEAKLQHQKWEKGRK